MQVLLFGKVSVQSSSIVHGKFINVLRKAVSLLSISAINIITGGNSSIKYDFSRLTCLCLDIVKISAQLSSPTELAYYITADRI